MGIVKIGQIRSK